MRHNRTVNHLSRKAAHKNALLSNMAASLILHKRIETTLAKAKALRSFVEPLLTRSKEDTTHNRRVVFSQLMDKEAVTELFREVSVKIAERPGGYTRILKTGKRQGDAADMCFIELVDYNELLLGTKESKTTRSTRTRRGASKKKADTSDKEKKPVKEKVAKTKVKEEKTSKKEKAVTENTEENKTEE